MLVNDWRRSILLPVIDEVGYWDCFGLEAVLTVAIRVCVCENQRLNGGAICLTLSGGLDSSFCLAVIRELLGPEVPIHTFTIGGSLVHPDILHARLVAARFGTIHHERVPGAAEIEEAKGTLYSRWADEPHNLGNVGVYLIYQTIARHGFRSVIAHDGIDELLGGYWEHRQYEDEDEKAKVFRDFWARLEMEHLILLERKASSFGIQVLLPYLELSVVEYISRIPLSARTSREVSKIPLRAIARKYLPIEIIERQKKGFCGALDFA